MIEIVTASRALIARRSCALVRGLIGHDLVPTENVDVLAEAVRAVPEGAGMAGRADLLAAASLLGATHPRLAERLTRASRWPL